MEAIIDSGGRLLLPKALRDALGLTPGSKVDISPYGTGVQITPKGRRPRWNATLADDWSPAARPSSPTTSCSR